MAKVSRQRAGRKKATRRPAARPVPKASSRRAKSMVVYGPSGVGKTSMVANAGGVAFIVDEHEEGIHDLVEYNQCPAPVEVITVGDFLGTVEAVHNAVGSSIQTLAIDSLTGLQHYCFRHCCEEDYDGDWTSKGFYSYQQGPATAATQYWEPMFIRALDNVMRSGINVILIAHSELKRYEDPMSAGYERHQPVLHKQLWNMTHRWVQCVLFYNYYTALAQKDGDTKKKPDATSESRNIYTVHSAAYEAKNRYGLPPVIRAGKSGKDAYTALTKALDGARK